MTFRISWDLTEDRWNALLAECPDATFFHTNGWLRAVARTFDSEIARVGIAWADGRTALLPLSIRRLAKGLVPVAIAGETGAYSGLVADAPLAPHELAAAYAAVRRRHASLEVVGNPFAQADPLPPAPARPGGEAPHVTHALALKPYEALREGFSRGAKSRGNKARKHGYALATSSDPADAGAFYGLYLDSVKRWGDKLTWARPRAYFEHLLREGEGQVRLFFATHDGEPISALLIAAGPRVAHYLHGATRADHLATSPANFLMEAALAHYADAGFTHFDFGASNGLAGVIQFKESFGALPLPYGSLRYQSPAIRVYRALRQWRDRPKPAAAAAAAPHPAAVAG